MTHVHYKFSSKLSYDTVVFDGPHITLKDLKRQIMGREKLRAGDCDLQITNAQTKEEYTDEEGLIPKGSSVIVRRIPNSGVKSGSHSKTRNTERSEGQHHHAFGAYKAMEEQSSTRALPLFSKMANLADADVSEEDKIKVVLNQSIYESMNYNKKFGAVLPSNYTCYRCGTTGHHIRNCPATGDKNFEALPRLKKSTGIPRSFLLEVDDPSIKGAMLTNSGHYAIPAIHAKAYAIGKKEKPPFIPQEQLEPEGEEDPVPTELLCLICHDLLSDAVVIPCCGNSYCDDCIRTALLDSEDHMCSTCGKSDVSPDTLIPNKFLRQAVNTFKKEQGQSKRGKCGSSQSQNPTPTPSPVPTPPPPTMQIQPQKPYQSTHSQQDPLLYCAQTADTPSSSQVCEAPPTASGPAPAPDTPSTFLQPAQGHLEVSDREPEERTHDDSAAAAPSVLVSHEDPTAAASQLIPLVKHTAEEQPQTVNPQQSSSGAAQRNPGPPTIWESASSSSGYPPTAWSELNNRQLPPSSSSSSSYPVAPPPLFPSPLFHTFLATQPPHNRYPPGYPPATPVWTLPTPQGAPIPSLCSSASSSSIPTLIPQNWYMHQRKKKERSPNRGSTYRRSSSRSKSSMSKSSHSYSRSSSKSRSRSRSRSQGRSRPHSPYSRHRNLHPRSQSSHSYSYGYKRSPTPSSSSSPRVGYRSRSKSPSDHHKASHHSRHHSKKSTSSRYSSRRRGEHPQKETGGEGRGHLYAQPANQTRGLELDRERYLQWKQAYKEWCEKYFNSYVGHFHQLPPPPLLGLPPSPPPQWVEREGSRSHSRANSKSRNRLQGRRTDGRSPPSQSSSDSRSPPSHSSSDSRSTRSQSSSESRSSLSHSSRDSRSPPSQSSSDGRSTPSEDGVPPRALTKGSEEAVLQERNTDDKQLITKKSENFSTSKHEQWSVKKHEKERGEVSSSPESTDDCRKDKKRDNSGPSAYKDGTPVRDKVTASEALESVQTLMKPGKHLDKQRKSREQRSLEMDKRTRSDKYSDSKQDVERRHKERRSKGAGRVDTDRYRNPEGSRASDSRSDKNRKRKGEDGQRSSVKAQSSKCLKTKITEVPETRKSESLNPMDGKKQNIEKKQEKKMLPLTEQDIWEGGIKVKPQKKISININLDLKRKEESTEKLDLSSFESIAVKTSEEIETTGNGEKLNRGAAEIEVNEKKESSRNREGEPEDEIKPEEREAKPVLKKDTHRDDEREMKTKEHSEEEDFDLWHYAFSGAEEQKKESKKQWEEQDRTEASEGRELSNDERRSAREGAQTERRVWSDGGGREMEESIAGPQKEKQRAEGGNLPKEELMEGAKWWMGKAEEEEGMTKPKSQRSRDESHPHRSNTELDDGSTYEDHEETKTVMKTLEEFTQDRAADREEDLTLKQVPRSKWEEEESEEEEQDQPEIKVQKEALAVFLLPLPSSSSSVSVTAETPTDRKMEGEKEQQRHREIENGRDRGRGREGEKNSRSVAPSSGRDRPDNTSLMERGGERRTEMERPKDRERGRESERPRDRQKESKRSKERTRDEGRGRDRETERGHGSRNLPSSSHDRERRDRHRGDDQSGDKSSWCPGRKSSSGSISRAGEPPDQNAHRTCRDTFPDWKCKDRSRCQNPRDTSGNYRHQDRPTGTRHSPPSLSHSWGKALPPESPGGSELRKPRMSSPGRELTQSKAEKGEYKRNRVDKVVKEGKVEGDADKLCGGRELEEGERPSSNSVSTSASQESSDDDDSDRGKEQKKKHRKEKRQGALELLEEGVLKKHKHKKAKKSRDGGAEGSSGEVDNKWKEEEECAKLCSLMLF
ncbi:E3 ubiquitin-protein ligase RBBP6-like isoform X3 [Acanthopagrus latus]|uniref:E3 ubiquitin-protein ligase RBBP6-like isoform X3 n=1 Tax=Acanthopagrus latus TaxID=8177 RepID=UPI00187CC9A7|nr:E3 ubiquitin-protein ligase RBBP6-like isoform X3 [Acanthopagrus latus]